MATITQSQKFLSVPDAYPKKLYDFKKFRHPRKCMVISNSLILLGIAIPFLMAMEIIPGSLLINFLGFGMVSIGSTLLLIKCGEI